MINEKFTAHSWAFVGILLKGQLYFLFYGLLSSENLQARGKYMGIKLPVKVMLLLNIKSILFWAIFEVYMAQKTIF